MRRSYAFQFMGIYFIDDVSDRDDTFYVSWRRTDFFDGGNQWRRGACPLDDFVNNHHGCIDWQSLSYFADKFNDEFIQKWNDRIDWCFFIIANTSVPEEKIVELQLRGYI